MERFSQAVSDLYTYANELEAEIIHKSVGEVRDDHFVNKISRISPYADIVFSCSDGYTRAHRVVLMAAAPEDDKTYPEFLQVPLSTGLVNRALNFVYGHSRIIDDYEVRVVFQALGMNKFLDLSYYVPYSLKLAEFLEDEKRVSRAKQAGFTVADIERAYELE